MIEHHAIPTVRPSAAGPGRFRRAATLVGLLLAIVIVVAACDAGDASPSEEIDGTTASGVIVDVQGTIVEVEEFALALADGSRLVLVPEAGALERAGFSPAHLREHMALAEPISVTYREEDGRNILTGVGDASD